MNDELLRLLVDAMEKFTAELKTIKATNIQIQNSLAAILNSTLQANAKPKDDEFTGYSLNTADQEPAHG